MMPLTVSNFSQYNLPLLFCFVSSVFALVSLVLSPLFCAVFKRDCFPRELSFSKAFICFFLCNIPSLSLEIPIFIFLPISFFIVCYWSVYSCFDIVTYWWNSPFYVSTLIRNIQFSSSPLKYNLFLSVFVKKTFCIVRSFLYFWPICSTLAPVKEYIARCGVQVVII